MENVSDGTQNAPYSQVEFVIDMASDESFKTVQQSLKGMQGVKSADLNLETRQVVVNSNLPVEELREMIADKTGHRVVLLGFGVSREHTENLQLSAAVAAIQNCATHSSIAGVVRFTESSTEVTRDSNSATKLIADGVIDGLKVDGQYCVAVHRNGDVTDEATSCGGVFEAPPTNKVIIAETRREQSSDKVVEFPSVIPKEPLAFDQKVVSVEPIVSDELLASELPLCNAKVVSVTRAFRTHLRTLIEWLSRNRPTGVHRFLKRVRSHAQLANRASVCDADVSRSTASVPEPYEMDIIVEVGSDQSTFSDLSEADLKSESHALLERVGLSHCINHALPMLVMRIVKVPLREPLTRVQLAFSNRFWPTEFHDRAEKQTELETAVSSADLAYYSQSVSIALANRGSSGNSNSNSNSAVMCNPRTQTVLAVANDDERSSHPLRHAVMNAIERVAKQQSASADAYLCTDMDAFVLRESCVMCAMALVHSRVGRVFFIEPNAARGGLVSRVKLHTLKALNHHFRVYRLILRPT